MDEKTRDEPQSSDSRCLTVLVVRLTVQDDVSMMPKSCLRSLRPAAAALQHGDGKSCVCYGALSESLRSLPN
jgi:hypothetical protein